MKSRKRQGGISIVIPVYNEGGNIRAALAEIKAKVRTPHNVLIVYDFEEDNTLPVVREMAARGEVAGLALVRNKYGRGVLNAIKTGFESADREAVLVVMADLSDDLAVVDGMYAKLKAGYGVVCGSRYMKGGRQIGGPFLKKALSRTAGLTLHLIAGIPTHDATNSFKMYSKELLDNIEIESTGGFELGMELVIKAHFKGYGVTEVPSTWKDRVEGESRFMLMKWLPRYLHWYFFAFRNAAFGKRPGKA
ncbi:MAG: glycosyltransferase family 2 protein [Deltaproteobacteria bacterium]|nr:glycosyltransferase family 2 protein [Deltaproteobacteria bacterium]MCL4873055.1 glycosyltransferase family 2 protein [bacterium]